MCLSTDPYFVMLLLATWVISLFQFCCSWVYCVMMPILQVFSSVSTTVFSTFSCDYVEDLEVTLLRADYSISCDEKDYLVYKV